MDGSKRRAQGSRVFVLRVLVEKFSGNGPAFVRRYILEDPFSRTRRGFASLDDLAAFLENLPAENRLRPG